MDDAKYEVRPVLEEELEAVADIYAEAFNEADYEEEWNHERACAFVRYLHSKQAELFFVATDENQQIIGGIAGVIKPWCDGDHLSETEVFVKPENQNTGISKLLIFAITEKALKDYGIVAFDGIVDATSDFPMKFYEKIGFAKTGFELITADPKEVLESLAGND